MFGLRRSKKPVRREPECGWTAVLDDNLIRVRDEHGRLQFIGTSDLSAVVVETNDSGPWGLDVWWLLFGSGEQLACAFPQGAAGEPALLEYLMALPGFDRGQLTKAFRSTANGSFPVWRVGGVRPAELPSLGAPALVRDPDGDRIAFAEV